MEKRAKIVTLINYNQRKVKPSFLTIFENETEIECMNANISLQKEFYNFIAQIIHNLARVLTK